MKSRAAQLEKQINVLVSDSVALLKARMSELGINATSTADLLKEAKDIVWRHRELQARAVQLQNQVSTIEEDQAKLVSQRQKEIIEKYKKIGYANGVNESIDISTLTLEYILKEISVTLSHRKRLQNHVTRLENELNAMEKAEEDKKILSNVPKQIVVPEKSLSQLNQSKSPRKSREHRSRSQEWPEVPNIEKIEENNPEILAQKILETGRQIEAGKFPSSNIKYNNSLSNGYVANESKFSSDANIRQHNYYPPTSTNGRNVGMTKTDSTAKTKWKSQHVKEKQSYNANRTQEPPRLDNFEDRLKSIITSVLNEDQNNRDRQQSHQHHQNHSKPPSATVTLSQLQTQESPRNSSSQYLPAAAAAATPTPATVNINQQTISTGYQNNNSCFYSSNGLVKQEQKSFKKAETVNRERERSQPRPDYTQVSPAKLALRRHLSQEKLAAASAQQIQQLDEKGGLGYVATRSIGDLVSGEIERTLEISNQHIINVAIDMSPILNSSSASSSAANNMPPKTERSGSRLSRVEDTFKKEEERVASSPSPLLRTVYSPISRPSSAEVGNPPTPTNIIHPTTILEGLAYPHRPKSPISHNNLATLAQVAYNQQSYSANTYPHRNSNPYSNMPYHNLPTQRQNNACRYTPVQLPRADIKPYQESYFTDMKDFKPNSTKTYTCPQPNFAPVEGLAATLHARLLNDGSSISPANDVKEESDTAVLDCMHYDSKYNSIRTVDKRPEIPKIEVCPPYVEVQDKKHMAMYRSSVLSTSMVHNATIKSEIPDRNFTGRNADYKDRKSIPQKRASPVIHGPIRSSKKSHLAESVADISSVVNNASQPLAISAISSPENNSGKSTPYNEEDRRPHEEGKDKFLNLI